MNSAEYRQYDTYKGIEALWLDEVPSHWGIKRLKEVSDINKATLTDSTPPNYEFEYIDIGSVTYGVKGFFREKVSFEFAPSRARRIVRNGDTIVSTVRTYLKAIAPIEGDVSDLIVSTGFAVISPRRIMNQKFCSYLLTSEFIIDEICTLSKGVSYPATNATEIGNLLLLIPPHAEQTAIATFLDTKTAQIDRKIELLSQKAEKYGKLKQSLINETVTRGLDKSVPMKDSGIEWIGDVPAHWEVKRAKEIFDISRGRVIAQTELVDDGDFPVYSSQTKNDGCLAVCRT